MNALANIRPPRWFGGLRAAAAVAIAAAAVVPASAEPSPPYWGPHMWEGGWWFLGPFTMLLFLAALVALIVLLVRWLSGDNRSRGPGSSTALDILRERFARGEIDKTEFEDRKKTLGA